MHRPKAFLCSRNCRAAETLSSNGPPCWLGRINILLGKVPQSGRIHVVQNGLMVPRENVIDQWRQTLFLRTLPLEARGWLIEVMKCVESFGEREFEIDEIYAFEPLLARLYPGNNNVRPKIRQQLQVLRDSGYLQFVEKGHYRRIQPIKL